MAQGIGVRQTNYIVDTQLILKTAGLIAATANGTIILDLGGGDQDFSPIVNFALVIDVSAIEVATTDEVYTIILEGSDSATFASAIEPLCMIQLGAAAAATFLGNTDVISDVGRYVVMGYNLRNEHTYRYVRLQTTVAGTIATGINFTAGLAKMSY
jgi:hypothetical protein